MLTALGDPMRQAIFERLSGGPQAVGALASELPVSRPAVSQHLKVDRAGLLVLRTYLDQQWERSLAAFAKAVEAEGDEPDDPDD
jgi:DNA-binding transcriptional ArsR family regulator